MVIIAASSINLDPVLLTAPAAGTAPARLELLEPGPFPCDAWDIFDPSGKGSISPVLSKGTFPLRYADFCRVMSQKVQFGRHLNRQMYK
ncbi:hypothetical protein AK812_SmicGene19060 [Symbiodinium microadriaticum]|uniref:Uncharacterized protein n=1 Tax=Symbiodinium microadriaticum TaxID=2951 RepID=A0A1Q9DTH0_SYMMI|nr:hypothetical protein AK812_SmicGene19060 [Symbiodinium microadriaticum]